MQLKIKLEGYKALCYLNEFTILVSKANALYLFDLFTNKLTFISKLDLGIFFELVCTSRLLTRLFRIEFRTAVYVDSSIVYLVFKNDTYKFNLNSFKLERVFITDRGLNYSVVKGLPNYKTGIYFGSYKSNLKRDKRISVYRIEENDVQTLYDFPMNEIEHIHAVISDSIRNKFWILTGDFDKAAGIWTSDPDFKVVRPVLRGCQNFRSCVAFPLKEGLLYATDSQIKSNCINLLFEDGPNNFVVKKIADLNGPCIYGGQIGEYYYFATSVEPYFGKHKFSIYLGLLTNQRADVISNPYMEIVRVDKNFNTTVIHKSRKDRLPFLFQFGAIMFPTNNLNPKFLIFYNMASKSNNSSTEIWNIYDKQ